MKGALPILEQTPSPPVLEGRPAAPPWPHAPTVEWQVCGHCNYDCSYCIQSKKHRQGFPDEKTLAGVLSFLSGLPGTWEVKTTGGEPFAYKGFLDTVVPHLAKTRHRISTLTNLSSGEAALSRFAALTFGRLSVVSASLHLEHTDVDAFLRRLAHLASQVASDARLVVNCVLVPGRLDEVAEAKRRVEGADFTFFPQLMKVKHGVFAYSPDDVAKVRALVGDLSQAEASRTANLAPAYTGRACWTGARYLVVTKEGQGWSCRSSKRHGEGYLGDAAAGTLRLREGPIACPYTICPCTVPANRGMIEGVPARASLSRAALDPEQA